MDSYRTPPEILKLEEQLRDKSSECEELRSANLDLKTKLARKTDPADAKDAREWWTWRLAWCLLAGLAAFITYAIWKYSMLPTPPEGSCREVIIDTDNYSFKECPYGGQTAVPVGPADDHMFKCTCSNTKPEVLK